MPTKLTNEILTAAIAGFETQKHRIDGQIAELRRMLSGDRTEAVAAPERKKGKRKMSAAARKRISEAQRKRWAAVRHVSAPAAAKPKPKRKLSAEGRKRIIEATKKRWALVRAQAAKTAKA